MLAYILGVLKIIGIILIILTAVVIIISILVLFVPIRYDISGVMNEQKKSIKATATWLLKLIRFKIEYIYPEEPMLSFVVLGFNLNRILFDSPSEKKDSTKRKSRKKKNTEKHNKGKVPASAYNGSMNEKRVEWERINEKDLINENDIACDEEKPNENIGENRFFKKGEKIIFKIRELYDKIKFKINNIQYYVDILQEEDTKILIKNAWESIYMVLLRIKPKYLSIKLIYGFSTPDTTGKVYGYYCMVSPILPDTVCINPDFENEVLNGTFECKGNITVFVILVNGLRILFDKRLQPLINKLKSGGKKHE